MKKRQKLNQRILIPTISVSIFLIIICVVLIALYLPGWGKQVSNIQSTRTAVSEGEFTQLANATNNAALVLEQETRSAAETMTAIPTFTLTPTLIPTSTSAPSAIICTGKVSGADRSYYLFPNINYRVSEEVANNYPISVLGRWPDKGWYKVSVNGKEGWIRDSFTKLDDVSCIPTIFTVSYLLGLDQENLHPILNDTFASNENIWKDQNGTSIKPIANTQTGDQQLVLNTKDLLIVTTDNQALQNVPVFDLVTSVTFSSRGGENSYFGVRFRENNANYYEIRIFPGDVCRVDVFDSEQEGQNSFFIDRKACVTNSYFVELSLNENSTLNLLVNGYDTISEFNLRDDVESLNGGAIKLFSENGNASFDFITVLSP